MQEQIRPHLERLGAPGQPRGFFDNLEPSHRPVHVSCGPYREYLPLGNTSVGEIRRIFAARFDIDPHGQAILDGRNVGDQTLVRPGQNLMFTRTTGEKGLLA